MSNITQELVDDRVSVLQPIPRDWGLTGGTYYQLDLKMCQIKQLMYSFYWGDERLPEVTFSRSSIVDQPSRILKLNVSLNDLTELTHEGLLPLNHLRILDASLNRIVRFVGIEVLTNLQVLNLSHNNIRQIEGLSRSHFLIELNLSMNEIEDISLMPSLTNITILHINNNRLYSLNGIQALSHLRELYTQRNKVQDLLPLSSSFQLSTLNAAYNQINSLSTTTHVLSTLHKLKTLSLMGNPIERDNNYRSSLIEGTTIISLDNTSIRPQGQYQYKVKVEDEFIETETVSRHNLMTIKDAARQAFREQLHRKKQQVNDNVSFLQQRIIDIQEDFREYEEKSERDLEACLRFLDGLNDHTVGVYTVDYFRNQFSSPQPPTWNHPEYSKQEPEDKGKRPKGDYRGIKDTDQILRFANHELTEDQKWNNK